MEHEIERSGREAAVGQELEDMRAKLARGTRTTQSEINQFAQELQSVGRVLRPNENDENLPLVDASGVPTGVVAPRWMCHLLGLRHTVVHVVLRWASPGLGDVFVFQVRSWGASVSPGQVDIAIGGHLAEPVLDIAATAYREMHEELGLGREHLVSGRLRRVTSYDWYEERPSENFYNSEWREVYIGDISPDKIGAITFRDGEVVGLYLCPRDEVDGLLQQDIIPLASALLNSLPRCLDEE